MSFDHKPIEELLRITTAGLGFTLNTYHRSQEDIARIQAAALKSGATITWTHVCDDHVFSSPATPASNCVAHLE